MKDLWFASFLFRVFNNVKIINSQNRKIKCFSKTLNKLTNLRIRWFLIESDTCIFQNDTIKKLNEFKTAIFFIFHSEVMLESVFYLIKKLNISYINVLALRSGDVYKYFLSLFRQKHYEKYKKYVKLESDRIFFNFPDFSGTISFCFLEDKKNFPLNMLQSLRNGFPIVIFGDLPLINLDNNDVKIQEYIKKAFCDYNRDRAKFFVYTMNGKKSLVITSIFPILHLMTCSPVVPIMTLPKFNGKILFSIGEIFEFKPMLSFNETGQLLCNTIYNLLYENLRKKCLGWDGRQLKEVFFFFRFFDMELLEIWQQKVKNYEVEIKNKFFLHSYVFFRKEKNTLYLINLYPFLTVKTEKSVKMVIEDIKKRGIVSPKTKKRIPEKKLVEILKNLVNYAIIVPEGLKNEG
ncbi:MAG: hypothetical protein ACP5Q5_00845 [Brevinematia bacterium]